MVKGRTQLTTTKKYSIKKEYLYGVPFLASENFTALSLGAWFHQSGRQVRMALYADDGFGKPGARLGYTGVFTSQKLVQHYEPMSIPVSVSVGSTCWIAIIPSRNVQVYYNDESIRCYRDVDEFMTPSQFGWARTSGRKVLFLYMGGLPSGCVSVCGNGIVEDGEMCDDGNSVNGDGCSVTCEIDTGACCSVCRGGVVGDTSASCAQSSSSKDCFSRSMMPEVHCIGGGGKYGSYFTPGATCEDVRCDDHDDDDHDDDDHDEDEYTRIARGLSGVDICCSAIMSNQTSCEEVDSPTCASLGGMRAKGRGMACGIHTKCCIGGMTEYDGVHSSCCRAHSGMPCACSDIPARGACRARDTGACSFVTEMVCGSPVFANGSGGTYDGDGVMCENMLTSESAAIMWRRSDVAVFICMAMCVVSVAFCIIGSNSPTKRWP